jgi:hypothetical protein
MTPRRGPVKPGKVLIFPGYKPVTLTKIGLGRTAPVSFTVPIC